MPFRNDSHSVIVLLAVENYVQTRLMEFLHRDAVRTLCEHLDLVDSFLFLVLSIEPLTLTNLRR